MVCFLTAELWEGAHVTEPSCLPQEAADLMSLKPKLDELGVPLYAVVKEKVKREVEDFQPYFKGEIFLDEKVSVLWLAETPQCLRVLSEEPHSASSTHGEWLTLACNTSSLESSVPLWPLEYFAQLCKRTQRCS